VALRSGQRRANNDSGLLQWRGRAGFAPASDLSRPRVNCVVRVHFTSNARRAQASTHLRSGSARLDR
jgi:hypothetical protein